MPTPEKANSLMLVRPTNAAPAARSRATAGQSRRAGGASASTVDPAAVTWSCTSNRSLIETARPASAGRAAPAAASPSIRRGDAGRGLEGRPQEGEPVPRRAAGLDRALHQRAGALAPRQDVRPGAGQVEVHRTAIIDGFFSRSGVCRSRMLRMA